MSNRLQSVLFLLALVAAVFLIYLPGLNADLVFDDARLTDGYVFENYGNLFELKKRMLSYGSFVWLQQLLGEGWWKQRLMNVFLHVGVCASLMLLVRTMLARVSDLETPTAAMRVAVMLFAVNPVAMYAVMYLIQRSTVMATLFVVLACYGFVQGLITRRVAWHALSLLSYVLAVLSKETAFTAAALAVPLYVFVARPSLKKAMAVTGVALALMGLGVAALLAVYGNILGVTFDENSRLFKQQLETLQPGVSAWLYPLSILNQMAMFVGYGFLWVVPNVLWMSVDLRPAFPMSMLSFPQVLGALVYIGLLAGATWLVLRRQDKWGLAGLFLLMPLLMFATEFATVWLQDPFVLYRSYLWAIAVPGLMALALMHLPSRAIYPVGVVVAGLFTGLALERSAAFKTELSVWTDAVEKVDLRADPNAIGRWRPFLNRGSYHLDHGNAQQAYRDFTQADGLGEPYGAARFSMGTSLQMMNRFQDALTAFEAAEKKGFTEAGLYAQRGEAFYSLGRVAEAYDSFSIALTKTQPPEAEDYTRMRRAECSVPLQKYDEAINDFTALLQKKPDDQRLQTGLGMAYVGKHQTKEAIALFDAVLAVRPSAPAFFGRGLAYAYGGNKVAGLKDLDQAISLAPNNPMYRSQRDQVATQK